MKISSCFSGILLANYLLMEPAFAALSVVGDIAFTAYSPSDENFAFVAFTDIDAGQSIFFDDEEWAGSSFATNTTEGNAQWVNDTGSVIPAGTIITISDAGNNAGGVANIGSISEINAGFSLSPTDGLFAYLGAQRDPSVFLAGIGDADSPSGLTSLTGTGLALGITALDTDGAAPIEYTGPRAGESDFSDYRILLNDISNWSSNPDVSDGVFDTTSIVVVPEPSSAILLGLVGLSMTCRRSRRC